MYQNFFGLSAEPFSIAPDPHFLFLSDRHEEALAHLSYGLQGSGGFILLTGEVGTGKTTVSRALLEQLTEQTRTAFILNPTLNEQELLATLCDEFGIRYAKRSATAKQLTDKLSQFLLNAYSNGEQCLVLIDEAQHLQPQVLEQLRLLTNLETDQQKLLRVILIGQPELQDLLRRRELRQLAQRITARYHLLPLTAADSARYIAYRLQVAGAQRDIFSNAAIRKLHQASEGIPRRLNVLCDRALLAAYNDRSEQVLPGHVRTAIFEVDGQLDNRSSATASSWPKLVAGFLLAVVVGYGASWGWQAWQQPAHEPRTANAVDQLLQQWQLPKYTGEQPLCEWLTRYQLACWQGQLRFDQLLALNYPAILQQTSGDYVWLGSRSGAQVPADWNGEAVVIWQPPAGYQSDEDRYQQWLQEAVARHLPNGDKRLTVNPANSAEIYQRIQQAAGLPVSGELDAATLVWLAGKTATSGPRLAAGEY